MKRRIFSIILCLLLIPGAMIFSACGESGYDLTELYDDYIAIGDHYNNVNISNDGEIEFDYSVYTDSDGGHYLQDAISSQYPYVYLDTFYNNLLENSLIFVSNYIDVISVDNLDASESERDALKASLDRFDEALGNTSSAVDELARIVRGNLMSGNITNQTCRAELKVVFDSYDELFSASFELNANVANIYFKYSVPASNTNISTIDISNFDALTVTNYLDGKSKSHISNLSFAYVEKFVAGGELSRQLTTPIGNQYPSLGEDYSAYLEEVNSIFDVPDASIGLNITQGANKQTFYNTAIRLYNLQTIMNNDLNMYLYACENLNYVSANVASNLDQQDATNKDIIDNYNIVLTEYTDTLVDIFEIMRRV